MSTGRTDALNKTFKRDIRKRLDVYERAGKQHKDRIIQHESRIAKAEIRVADVT